MHQTIPITEALRDYIERLHYESVRYKDLLATIHRECCPMTDEEWDSSLAYYKAQCEDAQFSLRCAMEAVYEMYGHKIGKNLYHIDFSQCAIVVGDPSEKSFDADAESFADQMDRLYPRDHREPVHINDMRVKDITLQVTDACNMACTYCYQHQKGLHSMTFETGKAFIDMLLDADERTNQYLTSTHTMGAVFSFIGGEPWLEIDLIAKLSDYIIGELFRRKHPWAIRFMFSVTSNGLLHFDKRVQDYLHRHRLHLGYSISIDGNKKLHDACRIDRNGAGTYDRAMAGVHQYINELGGQIGSKVTIAPGNVNCVGDAVLSMIEQGYRHINLNCVYEEGWDNTHARELYWQLHQLTDLLFARHLENEVTLSIFDQNCGHPMSEEDNNNWCGGTGLMLAVDYKGDIYPCLRYMESSIGNRRPPYTIGNIQNGIWKEETHCQRMECLSRITRRSQSTDACWNCPIASGCGWCSAYNYECFGTPDKRATYICCMHKARVLANVYYWRRKGAEYAMDCPEEFAVPLIGEEEYQRLCSMCSKGGV